MLLNKKVVHIIVKNISSDPLQKYKILESWHFTTVTVILKIPSPFLQKGRFLVYISFMKLLVFLETIGIGVNRLLKLLLRCPYFFEHLFARNSPSPLILALYYKIYLRQHHHLRL